jgi:hypothetical protein
LINAGSEPVRFAVPRLENGSWQLMVNTASGCADVPLSIADGFVLEGPALALLMTTLSGSIA